MKLSIFSKMHFLKGTNSGCNIVNEVVDKKRRSNEDLKVHQEKRYFSMWLALPCYG